ncbi:putative xanthine dehydrogenase subunit A [Neomoorella glycerini]|uniref:Putative xanthine dehydrogenase subunit A n=1 Tax=Neomoorella glycerini TaxID=55779 RepID=A0A6I5ZNY8_9FIRM|nr:XdhC family protein [Moorella glycerini]QGP91241.1 putative xanthine dehydrogenase subunit A [Moorella glycerini]
MDRELIRRAVALMERGEPCAMATIIQVRGSAPREAGTRMLIRAGGETVGTTGGGCAEAAIRQRALLVMETGVPEIYHLDLTADTAAEEGMVCGGVMDVFIEPLGG